jgi:polyhydroxybutyrate depolymerase
MTYGLNERMRNLSLARIVFVALLTALAQSVMPIGISSANAACTNQIVTSQYRSITVDGQARTFYISTPTTAAPSQTLPVVFSLHGTGGAALISSDTIPLNQQGPGRGYVIVTPNATIKPGNVTSGWNKGTEAFPDEIKFFETILENIQDVACVNQSRIYATGFSNGSAMAAFLACRWNKIAGSSPWSGGQLVNPARCSARPVHLLFTQGTADVVTPPNGPSVPDPNLADNASYQGTITRDVDYWAYTTNGCLAKSLNSPVSGVTRTLYTGCSADTELYEFQGGGHAPFQTPLNVATLALDFFDTRTRIAGPDYAPPPTPPFNYPVIPATVSPTLTVLPAGQVTGGSVVSLSATGFTPNTTVAVTICKRGKAIAGPSSCQFSSQSALALSNSFGVVPPTAITVIQGAINGSGDQCGPSSPCVYTMVALGRPCELAQIPVSFTGGVPQDPVILQGCPRLQLSRSAVSPGEEVLVNGVAFPPNRQVSLATWFVWPVVGNPSSPVVTVTSSSEGTFTIPFTAPGFATGLRASDPLAGDTQFTVTPFLVPGDRCAAYGSDETGGTGCATAQQVNVSILQGTLVQRAYASGLNPNATTISLGSIISPTAPTALNATLNPITVSDSRGGTFGWSLTAVLSTFSGSTGTSINNSRASVTASCAPATAGTAWEYSAVGQTAVSGYESFYAAGGAAGGGSQSLGSAVNLCTKDGTVNATTGSTGGIYNATAGISLVVPAFQASDSYVAILTVTLA